MCSSSPALPATKRVRPQQNRSALPLGFAKAARKLGCINGRYQLLRKIGSGAVGTVYDARDMRSRARVAVKLLHVHLNKDADVRRRFIDEAEIAARVRHPALVEVYEQGTWGDVPFIAMELVRGPSLRDFIRHQGALVESEMLRMFTPVAAALAEVHAAGIVHRDVKPANLLVTKVGDRYTLKVTDFGYARVLGRSRTTPGFCVGTSAYMSPEQVLAEDLDGRTDVYALGMSMFYAITGELPFASVGREQLLGHQLHSKVPSPTWFVESISEASERIVTKALRKDRDLRFKDMDAMCRAMATAMRAKVPKKQSVLDLDVYEPKTKRGKKVAAALRALLSN